MKRFFSLLIITTILSIFITGCVANSGAEDKKISTTVNEDSKDSLPKEETPKYTVNDFLPKKEDLKLTFAGGFENAGEEVYVEYLKDDKAQVKTINAGAVTSSIYEVQKDALVLSFISEDNTIKKELFSKVSNSKEALLCNPIKEGSTWKDGTKTRVITAVDVSIEIPAGYFAAVEVTTSTDEYTQKDYYVKDLGRVKTIFETNGSTFITELKSIEENTKLIANYRFFYMDIVNDKNYYIEEAIEELQEEELQDIIIDKLYNPPSNNYVKLAEGVTINSISILDDKDYIHIDISSDFQEKMNFGVSAETGFLSALTNTLGFNYGLEKVMVTLDGKPYSSGHLYLEAGETFTVDISNYIPKK